jgi:hypothetical protein
MEFPAFVLMGILIFSSSLPCGIPGFRIGQNLYIFFFMCGENFHCPSSSSSQPFLATTSSTMSFVYCRVFQEIDTGCIIAEITVEGQTMDVEKIRVHRGNPLVPNIPGVMQVDIRLLSMGGEWCLFTVGLSMMCLKIEILVQQPDRSGYVSVITIDVDC